MRVQYRRTSSKAMIVEVEEMPEEDIRRFNCMTCTRIRTESEQTKIRSVIKKLDSDSQSFWFIV